MKHSQSSRLLESKGAQVKTSLEDLVHSIVGMQSSLSTVDQLIREYETLCRQSCNANLSENEVITRLKELVKACYSDDHEGIDKLLKLWDDTDTVYMAKKAADDLQPVMDYIPDPEPLP